MNYITLLSNKYDCSFTCDSCVDRPKCKLFKLIYKNLDDNSKLSIAYNTICENEKDRIENGTSPASGICQIKPDRVKVVVNPDNTIKILVKLDEDSEFTEVVKSDMRDYDLILKDLSEFCKE